MKPEVMTTARSSAKLKALDITSKSNFLKPINMLLGAKASSIIKRTTTKDHEIQLFLKQVNIKCKKFNQYCSKKSIC